MVLMNIPMHFGRTASHIGHYVTRPYIFTGGDAHIFGGIILGKADYSEIPYTRIAGASNKLQRRTVCCFNSLRSNLDKKSIGAVVLPVSSDSPATESRVSNGFLHANTSLIPLSPKRGICTLVSMVKLTPMKNPPSAYAVTQPTQPARFTHRKNCAEWCGTDPCDLMRKATVQRPSMWLDPNCFNKLVCPPILRYDVVHIPGSDKATREYQQTWIECPPRVVPKVQCCFDPLDMPPICRRPRKVRPTTATHCQTQNECKQKDSPCPRIQMPCCDIGRKNQRCIVYPTPSCCKKRCTPFPSFSECVREDLSPKHPEECFCLARPSMCEIWADWRKKCFGTR